MIDHYKFQLNTQLTAGVGISRTLPALMKSWDYTKTLLLVDEGVIAHCAYFNEIMELLRPALAVLIIEPLRGSTEPDYDYVDTVAAKVRALPEIDSIIAIGGGSCLDVAKAIAVLRTNPGRALDYRGFDKVTVPGVPTICIPSTAGTGSEVTINASFIDLQEKKKLGINGRHLHATHAILDAEWTMSCPKSVAVSSGMDALVHSLESYMCRNASPITRVFSAQAFARLYKTLPCLVDDPLNKEKRQDLLLGSYLAAIGLFNSGSGIAGALSYPLGVFYGVPHGIGGGIFIASVLEYNVSKGYTGYTELFDLVQSGLDLSDEQKNQQFARMIRVLSENLGVPRYLTQWGITRSRLDEVANLMRVLQGAFDQNPVPFSADQNAKEVLERHTE